MNPKEFLYCVLGYGNSPDRENVPYDVDYRRLNRWRALADLSLIVAAVLSLIPLVSGLPSWMSRAVGFLAFLALILNYTVTTTNSTILLPKADHKRIIGLVDDSFHTQFSVQEVSRFFDNAKLDPGVYKLIANSFQNTHTTYRLLSEQTKCVVLRTSVVSAILLAALFSGIKDNALALPLPQRFLSTVSPPPHKHPFRLTALAPVQSSWIAGVYYGNMIGVLYLILHHCYNFQNQKNVQ